MPDTDARLEPIGLGASILYFGIPSAVFSASILGLLPWMIRHGYSIFLTFNVTFGVPLGLMLAAAFVFYRLERRPWTWAAFRDRMRLRQPTGRDWLWTAGLLVVIFGGQWLFGFITPLVSGLRLYDPPPEFGTVMSGLRSGTFGGLDVHGRWDIFVIIALSLVVLNIFGEELWWRGIILPRQELALGSRAWLANGLLWNLFHMFYHTDVGSLVGYLPATVPLAFVAQRTRNTWPGIIAHLITNSAVLIVLWKQVAG